MSNRNGVEQEGGKFEKNKIEKGKTNIGKGGHVGHEEKKKAR